MSFIVLLGGFIPDSKWGTHFGVSGAQRDTLGKGDRNEVDTSLLDGTGT